MRIVARSKGFILIEVVIVSVIIAIFAAVAYPSYLRFINDGYAEQAKAVMNAMATAERINYQNNSVYVTMGASTFVSVASTQTWGNGLYSIGQAKIDTGDAGAFQFAISVPDNTRTFIITAKGRGSSFGMTDDKTVIYSFDRTSTTERGSWKGTLLAVSE